MCVNIYSVERIITSIITPLFKEAQTMNTATADKRQKYDPSNAAAKAGKHITVLDTDLGTDDAYALFVLKKLPLRPDYIVASYGNVPLDTACKNAVLLTKYLGIDVPIVKGLDMPFNENADNNECTFHGKDGLGNQADKIAQKLNFTQTDTKSLLSFDDFAAEIANCGSVTYITVGTLTNISYLLENEDFRRKTNGIYIMGGGINEFNCPHNTEFNFCKDPEGVKKVLTSGLKIVLFPLDFTNHNFITAEQIDELEKIGTYKEYIDILRYNLESNKKFDKIPAAVLHDVFPVMYAAQPEWFETEEMRVASNEYGSTFISPSGNTVNICRKIENNKLFDVIKSVFEG